MRAFHALLTLIVGVSLGLVWLKAFWYNPDRPPLPILVAPAAAALLGLGHWVAYDFSLAHWAGDFSLFQAIFNFTVVGLLLHRRNGHIKAGVR